MIVAVVGLEREARIVAGSDIAISRRGTNLPALIAQGAQGIISIGIAAGLDPTLKVGDCVIASHVVIHNQRYEADESWARSLTLCLAQHSPLPLVGRDRVGGEATNLRADADSEPPTRIAMRSDLPTRGRWKKAPEIFTGVIAGGDVVVASASEKDQLRAQTSALAADMESHIAARAAAEANIPFAALRIVSDEASEALPPAAIVAMRADGIIDIGAVVGSLMVRPAQIPALMRTARNAEIAFRALLRCRDALGPRLAFPDLG
ncbi:MAG TPA: hypothetical protein VEH07_03600 [Alphaproteobacteria bacterium]|nr:hypothetical protein [Alphaproteobacteria bacterium]